MISQYSHTAPFLSLDKDKELATFTKVALYDLITALPSLTAVADALDIIRETAEIGEEEVNPDDIT